MESENCGESSKHQRSNDGDQSNQNNALHYSNTSASSHSSSSSDSNPLESDVDDNDSILQAKSKYDLRSTPADWSMMSVSPRASPSEFSTYKSMSTLSPPPPQAMGRPPEYPGYDPNRIPASVFVTNNYKPTSTMEWSVTSNESLFSIHMGNSSFTRDHFNLMKSGELKSPDHEFMNTSPGLPPISETTSDDLHRLPVVDELPSDNGRKSTSCMGREYVELEEAHQTEYMETLTSAERFRISTTTSNVSDGHGMHPAEGAHTPARASHQSDGSRMSNSSFAFPVLGGETPLKSPIHKPELQQPEAPEVPQKAAETNKWFTCFSCWPVCNGYLFKA